LKHAVLFPTPLHVMICARPTKINSVTAHCSDEYHNGTSPPDALAIATLLSVQFAGGFTSAGSAAFPVQDLQQKLITASPARASEQKPFAAALAQFVT
jgi:hypothetical protein